MERWREDLRADPVLGGPTTHERGAMLTKLMALVLLGASFLNFTRPQAAVDNATFIITQVDAQAFPMVNVAFRAVDDKNQAIPGLAKQDVSLYEEGQQVAAFDLTELEDAPLHVTFVIDLGRYANYKGFGLASVRRALTHFVDGDYFQDSKDTVQVLARVGEGQSDQTILLLEPTQSGAEFIDFINSLSFNPSSGATQGLLAIEDALGGMAIADDPGLVSTAVVFLANIIDRPAANEALASAQGLAQLSMDNFATIYALHTRSGGGNSEPLRALADGTGGQYLLLLPNTDQRSELDRLYRQIAGQRGYYLASYRSQSGASGPRSVAVVSSGKPSAAATSTGEYAVSLQAPVILVTTPLDGSHYDINIKRDRDDQLLFSMETISIAAKLGSWPDGHARSLTRAELLVEGVSVSSSELEPEASNFSFTWDITSLSTEEGTRTSSIRVRATDEFGLVGESDPITVELNVVEERTFLQNCLSNILTPPCLAAFVLPPVVVLALAGVGAGVLVFVLNRRLKPVTEASTPETPQTILVEEQLAPQPGRQVLARLHVLLGPVELQGADLPIHQYVTSFGREPQESDIAFYAGSSSSISAKHCTLQLYFGKFYLTDNKSRNGTRINGDLIEPDKPVLLKEGDEIVLGDLALRGVKLRFSITLTAKEHAGIDATALGTQMDEDDLSMKTVMEADEDELPPGLPPSGESPEDDRSPFPNAE